MLAEADRRWAQTATRLIARLYAHTARLPILRIDHIGSTSVPGLAAKNLIDIQIIIDGNVDSIDVAHAVTGAGFVHVAGRWSGKDRDGNLHPEQVCVDADPARPVNINIREDSRPVARDALLYRDWLRANRAAQDSYLALKRGLAGRHVDDYGESKEAFISEALRSAEAWASQRGWDHLKSASAAQSDGTDN